MDGWIDKEIDRCMCGQIDKERERWMDRQRDRLQIDGQKATQRQIDRHMVINRDIYEWIDRQIDKDIDTWTDDQYQIDKKIDR